MPMEVSYLAAFLVGLLGGVHCVGMCGGIVGALSLGLPQEVRASARMLPYLLAYNLARIASYTLAGALLGGVGYLAAHWSGLRHAQLGLQVLAALFMIALGLYLAGWWLGLARLERVGGRLWQRIEPLGRRFLPVRTPGQAFLLGLLWGWLPCGLVYSVLVWSISRGDAIEGGMLMLSFGLGTLPTLLLMGVAATRLSVFVRHVWVRRVAGMLVMSFGLWTLYPLLSG